VPAAPEGKSHEPPQACLYWILASDCAAINLTRSSGDFMRRSSSRTKVDLGITQVLYSVGSIRG